MFQNPYFTLSEMSLFPSQHRRSSPSLEVTTAMLVTFEADTMNCLALDRTLQQSTNLPQRKRDSLRFDHIRL